MNSKSNLISALRNRSNHYHRTTGFDSFISLFFFFSIKSFIHFFLPSIQFSLYFQPFHLFQFSITRFLLFPFLQLLRNRKALWSLFLPSFPSFDSDSNFLSFLAGNGFRFLDLSPRRRQTPVYVAASSPDLQFRFSLASLFIFSSIFLFLSFSPLSSPCFLCFPLDLLGIDDLEMDEDARPHFPCPFCYENFDVMSLCSHLEDEHSCETRVTVCTFPFFYLRPNQFYI